MSAEMQLQDFIDDNRRGRLARLSIPWSDPAFSRRALREHLSQKHDVLTRRAVLVDRLVGWIHRFLCQGRPKRILDLACGPGSYCHRLAALGHRCTGVDISPAAIEYARQQAREQNLSCDFIEADLLGFEVNQEYDIIMLTFGDWNTFRRQEAMDLLDKMSTALMPNGLLLLETITAEGLMDIGNQENSWYTEEQGIFSAKPYLCLEECHWDAEANIATVTHFIIEEKGRKIQGFRQEYQAYTQEELSVLLYAAGFDFIEYYPELPKDEGDFGDELILTVARKPDAASSSAVPSDGISQ